MTEILSYDCNNNDIPDETETIDGGDFDADGDVDLVDFASLIDCLGGPASLPSPAATGCTGICLDAFDGDADDDVDFIDFAEFQVLFTG